MPPTNTLQLMSETGIKRELGRGERVLPGLWRLRLPLPWPGVPHCNAWAIAAGDGIVLVDCGMSLPGSLGQLERAMDQVGLRLDLVRHLVITHAHSDHWGQAASVVERSGAEVWMHPNYTHATAGLEDPEAALARRIEVGRQSGVPEPALQQFLEHVRELPSGVAGVVHPDHELVNGVRVETDLGPWEIYETPGHAPSHVCLFQPDRRLLISGDHLLGRIALFFEYGWTPDPIGEFLTGLDLVDGLGARLCMSGHGRTFTDVAAHVQGNKDLVGERLDATRYALREGPLTALEVVPGVFGEPVTALRAHFRIAEALCYLTHLERRGEVARDQDGTVERWRLLS